MPAFRNSDGSVVVDGVTLTASQVASISNASAANVARPLVITTGSGKLYGKTGTPRYGMFYKGGKVHSLDANGNIIPNTGWKPSNASRSAFKFTAV